VCSPGSQISLEEQLAQWEERESAEKAARPGTRAPMMCPPAAALALAQKSACIGGPARRSGALCGAQGAIRPGGDAENDLRSATLEFIDTVRSVELEIAAARSGDAIADAPPAPITEQECAHWPSGG
jgi:XTP/dITP diphosphohydrolase